MTSSFGFYRVENYAIYRHNLGVWEFLCLSAYDSDYFNIIKLNTRHLIASTGLNIFSSYFVGRHAARLHDGKLNSRANFAYQKIYESESRISICDSFIALNNRLIKGKLFILIIFDISCASHSSTTRPRELNFLDAKTSLCQQRSTLSHEKWLTWASILITCSKANKDGSRGQVWLWHRRRRQIAWNTKTVPADESSLTFPSITEKPMRVRCVFWADKFVLVRRRGKKSFVRHPK